MLAKIKEMNMISNCDCKNEQQDRLHGKGQRVFNKLAKSSADAQYGRCTVCNKEKVIRSR